MANFNEEIASAYDWTTGGVYVIEKNDPVEGGVEGISNRQGRELAHRTRNLHERLEDLKQDTTESAAELAEAIDAKDAATLRTAREYTDARETAILAAADSKDATTLRTAKDYADRIVAALVDNSPEALNTLQELANALGGDPNFATTVMQLVGEKATMGQVNAALAEKADKNGSTAEVFRAARLFLENVNTKGVSGGNYSGVLNDDDVFLMNWDETKGSAALLSKEDPYFVRMGEWVKRPLWHSGNFDPTTVMKQKQAIPEAALHVPATAQLGNGTRAVARGASSGLLVSFAALDSSASPLQFYLPNFVGGPLTWRNGVDNDKLTEPNFKTIYDSGNLGLATTTTDGLMSAADKYRVSQIKRIICGSTTGSGRILVGSGFSAVRQGDYLRIEHNLGHSTYVVAATINALGRYDFREYSVVVMAKTNNYVDFYITNGEHLNSVTDCAIDFVLNNV